MNYTVDNDIHTDGYQGWYAPQRSEQQQINLVWPNVTQPHPITFLLSQTFCNPGIIAVKYSTTYTVDNDIHSSGYHGWFALECVNKQNHNWFETGGSI